MLKSIAKIVRLLKGIPKVGVDNNNRFMRQLNAKIKEFEDGRHNKSSDWARYKAKYICLSQRNSSVDGRSGNAENENKGDGEWQK